MNNPLLPFVSPFVLGAENGGFWLLLAPLVVAGGWLAGGSKLLINMGNKRARPEGFEPPTFGFEVHRSIH